MKVKKLIVFGMTMMAILVSCERHPSFSSSEEALQGCKQQLELLKQEQDASIEDLSSLTSTWLEVRDSAYSSFGRDSSLNLKSPMAVAYFMVSDSIRAEITRLAFVKPRSLREVMYFKLNTAMQRKVLEKNAIFKDAVKYYEKLDTYPLYPSLKTTLAAYGKLLSSATSSKQGDELMNFIALEDKCFRSLMKYLAQVDTETLQKLTMGTTRVFDGLYSSVGAQVDDVNDRTMLYLSMRFNRRIIQNALACKEDILSRRRLGNTQQANYRWMLIQPFMAIDDYSAAVLTEEQREQLLALSDDLPGLPASKQVMMEDLVEWLEKKLGLHILYASKQNYGKLLKAAAYSTPVDGSMFIIHMGSEQYGVIDSLTVHFYDSAETMLLGIQHVLRDVTRVPAEVLEYQKMDEILSFFF